MTTEQFSELLVELRAIKAALQQRALKSAAPTAGLGDIPAPTEIIPNAGAVEVHFGKNQGKRLDDLSAKSVEWYAQEQEPRLKKDGTPFPPRPADVLLRNAARTLVYQRLGKLPGDLAIMQPQTTNEDDISF